MTLRPCEYRLSPRCTGTRRRFDDLHAPKDYLEMVLSHACARCRPYVVKQAQDPRSKIAKFIRSGDTPRGRVIESTAVEVEPLMLPMRSDP